MNRFECRTCKHQFHGTRPRCPANANHTVVLVTTGQVQVLPTRNSLASATATPERSAARGAMPVRDRVKHESLMANDFRRYTQIVERRDFYRWFYGYTARLGYTTRWALAASVVATGAYEVAIMHPMLEDFGRMAHTVSNELQAMLREGNQVIFDNVFPKLRQLVLSGPLTGRAAFEWDMRVLSEEQTLIQPLYQGVSQATRNQLNQIARLQGPPGLVATVSPSARVDADPPYIQEGRVPAFAGSALTSIDERWHYGMTLGNVFTPGGTGYDPAIHRRPAASAGYVNGSELTRVRTRPNLHRLDATLDGGAYGAEWIAKEAEAILRRLTPVEQAEFLRDQMPGGYRYSMRTGLISRTAMISILATWRVGLEVQMRFLGRILGGLNEGDGMWRNVRYREVAPLIRPFSAAEKQRLHTPEWQRIFTLMCDDTTLLEAARDLGLPEHLRTQWFNGEKGFRR